MDDNKLSRLSELLRQALDLYSEDREMAIANYNILRDQHSSILEAGMEMSEEGKVEKELNSALQLVFKSGERLDGVIETLAKIITSQLNSESRERTAIILSGQNPDGKAIVNKPVDLNKLLLEATQREKED